MIAGVSQARASEDGRGEPASRVTWKQLADRWRVPIKHGGYRRDGTWYHLLTVFPAAYFDRAGYVLFEDEEAYRSCPGALFAKEPGKNWANFPSGISSLAAYVSRASESEEDPGRTDDLLSAFEGSMRLHYVRHRERERRLRTAKIRAALAAGGGRLECEVPRCRFDFEATYGDIGRGFAHVHHVEALGERDEARETTLQELAVVCANCHAMIHAGGQCRTLQAVSPRRRRRSA